MTKLIRWPGLIAFVVIVGLIAAVSFLFMDTWLRIALEKGLEHKTGAEVNVASVSHQFSPFGVQVNGLQITDARKPSHNQIQAEQIKANVALAPLLLRKVIIDNLDVSGVQLDQPRDSEGAVYREPEEQDSNLKELFPTEADIPTVDELLAKSPLKTTKAAKEAQAAYEKHKAELEARYQALPSKDKLADYKKRVKALTDKDYKNPVELANAKKEFDKLKDELKKDKAAFSQFKQSVQAAKADLSPKIAALKAAPGQDYDQLKALAAGDSAALQEVTTAVFGDKAGQWSEYLLTAFNTIAPMMGGNKAAEAKQSRWEGRWIAFDDASGLPDILIKEANVSFKWQQEVIESQWFNLTHQHEITGKPSTFAIHSSASQLWQSLKLDGDFSILASGLNASQRWQLAGLVLPEQSLSEGKLTSSLQGALLASSGELSIQENLLDGLAKIDLSQLVMSANGENKLTKAIASALTGLSDLSISSDISGNIDAPNFALTSDLDKQLGQALLSNLGADQKAKLDELKTKLNGQAAGPLADSEGQLGQLLDWQNLADGNMGSLDELLNSQFKGLLDKKKDKLLNKLLGG